jgi:hypothetical protein
MLKKTLLGLVAVIVLVAAVLTIVIATQPSKFHVERSLTMMAPPEAAFAQVNDFRKWEKWSPWLEEDPSAKHSYEGSPAGEGAIFRWAGNEQVGEGSMTILESQPPGHIKIELHFIKPFEDIATTDFLFTPAGDETMVTWTMDGKHTFISKAMCLFVFDMDKMIGGKYDEGLASMKKIVESEPSESVPAELAPAETAPDEPAAESAPAAAPSET